MKLYEISERYKNLAELLANPDFAEDDNVLDALSQIEDEFDEKVRQTVFILKNIEAEIAPIDSEIKRLQAMKKARQNNVERIKHRLRENLAETGIAKVNCGVFNVSLRVSQNSAVEIDEAAFLANNVNENLVRVKIEPNKTEIKAALSNGAEIIGAKLVSTEVLTIR